MRDRAAIVVVALLPCLGLASGAFAASAEESVKAQPAPPARPALRRTPRVIASPLTDHFALRASVLVLRNLTSLRIDPSGGALAGTPVNAESDLGLKDRTVQGQVELMFRMRERSRLRMDFFRLNRDGDRFLTRPIVFGDNNYLLSDHVISQFNWQMLTFTYTYSFLKTERFELGGGLGLHFLQADASGIVRARALRQSNSAVGGFPTVALDGTWRISSRFATTLRLQYFSATVSGVSGTMTDSHFDLQYRWKPNFQVGLGFSSMATSVESSRANKDLQGRFDLHTRGPEAFVRVSF